MNEIDESRDLDEIVKIYGSHGRFSLLPDDLQTQQGAYDWLRVMNHEGIRGITYYWMQIPVELVTDTLRGLAIDQEPSILSSIDPKDTPAYAELCQFAYELSTSAVDYIDQDYRTEATVAAMIKKPRNFTFCFLNYDWIAGLMTPQMTEDASLACPEFMSMLPVNQISQAALDKHLSTGYLGYRALQDEGKVRLAADYLRKGHWPAPEENSALIIEKPQSLEEALKRIFDEDEWDELYIAYAMSFPLEEVVPLMNHRLIELALRMYTVEELRPLMKTNRYLSGVLLEDALGL
jgi:hypothetical protein